VGFAFQGRNVWRKALTRVVSFLYRISFLRAEGVIFQNGDNLQLFVSKGLVPAERCHVVDGSGVELSHFGQCDLPSGPPTFLLIARLLGEKGLREYVSAARVVKMVHPEARFELLGAEDSSPDRIPLREVMAWHAEGVIDYKGETPDVRPFIAACHVCVLPSYHEGVPRSVLEAMAMGRPILTTDVPGCRETVREGVNGFLVPSVDSRMLANRMLWFIENRNEWQRMGKASRALCEERFDVHAVNKEILRITGTLNASAF
jgi:glycosyltransferase involved in cell wall biosynthesis